MKLGIPGQLFLIEASSELHMNVYTEKNFVFYLVKC